MKKICLNCKKDWDLCLGHKCLTIDGACCDTDICKSKIQEYNAFGYVLSDE